MLLGPGGMDLQGAIVSVSSGCFSPITSAVLLKLTRPKSKQNSCPTSNRRNGRIFLKVPPCAGWSICLARHARLHRSAELQFCAIVNAPVPRRAGALRSDGRRTGVHAKHISAASRQNPHAGKRALRSATTFPRCGLTERSNSETAPACGVSLSCSLSAGRALSAPWPRFV